MIKTVRVKEPAFFKSNELKDLKSKVASHFAIPFEERSQSKFPLTNLQERLEHLNPELLRKTDNKCAYCEIKIEDTNSSIEHFRPHYAAADLKGKISPDSYWWLWLNWNNLIPVCQECNANKKNYFPVAKKRATVKYTSKNTLYNKEHPLLIDPEFENPEEYFYYDETGRIFSKTERGNITINVLNLNRTKLILDREDATAKIKLLKENLNYLRTNKEIQPSKATKDTKETLDRLEQIFNKNTKPFSGIQRYLIRQFLLNTSVIDRKMLTPSLKRKLTIKLKEDKRVYEQKGLNNFSIETINIQNYKSINEINLNFKPSIGGKASWAILIGENGVGKSSSLTGTLKTLIGRSYRGFNFDINEIRRDQVSAASISISFNNPTPANVLVSSDKRPYYTLPKGYFINTPIIAFGPFKHSNKNDRNTKEFKGSCFVNNFFDASVPLHNANNFILKLNVDQFNQVAIALLDLLMLENKAKIDRDTNKELVWYQYNESGQRHYFDQLSDGYQSIITLGCNIIEGLLINNESIENASGFVVIDEIGANLHPRWKMQIVKRLRRTFPRVQFLVTTHDPLCLKGIEKGETYVLKSNNGELEVLTDLPNPSEFRADQLLTSEFFGLYSTVDPEIEKDYNEYYALLKQEFNELNQREQERLEELKNALRFKNHLGDSLREELLYKAVDTVLAKYEDKEFSRSKIESEVKEKALSILDDFIKNLE